MLTSFGIPDIADSDAVLTTGAIKAPQIRFTAGLAGQNNHTLDFGFRGIALPLDLLTFTGKKEIGGNELKWSTDNEINTERFEVENSINGNTYSVIATIATKGNNSSLVNNYGYLHKNPAEGINYYRLRMIDIDGKYKYSPVIKIENAFEKQISILTYPNPASSELRITIPAVWQNKPVTYEIVSLTGQVVSKTARAAAGQTETTEISKLQAGFYMVKVTCDGQVATQKIVKQ